MPDDQQPGQAEEAGGAAAGPEPAEAPATEPVKLNAGSAGDLPAVPPPGPAEPMLAVPAAEAAGAPEPKAAPKKRGRPPGSRNKPKPPPATVPADAGAGGEQAPQAPVAPEPERQPEQPEQPRRPVHLTPAQMRRVSAEPLQAAGRGRQHGCLKGTMMPLERRNEPQMVRSFWKQYPSYRVQPLLYKRYNELVKARTFNDWLENWRIRKEGEEYTDAVGRLTDTVNRRLPQLRYGSAERAGVRRAARDVAAQRNTHNSGVVGGIM